MPSLFLDVDPRELRVPSSRRTGADPMKFHRQIARFGRIQRWDATDLGLRRLGRCDGHLVIFNGVTRATRIFKLAPGNLVRVEVIGKWRWPCSRFTKIGDLLS